MTAKGIKCPWGSYADIDISHLSSYEQDILQACGNIRLHDSYKAADYHHVKPHDGWRVLWKHLANQNWTNVQPAMEDIVCLAQEALEGSNGNS